MSVLFATNRTPGTHSGHLVEFKAGRTLLEVGSTPDKRKAVADKAKGLIFIKQSSDQLMHFCWKNREKNTTDLDLIIFPGETEFVRIKECAEGRVYMLKFKSSDDHKLFWLQDAKTDKDEEYCKKVNELLNNPPSSRARGGLNAGSDRSGSTNPLAALNSAIATGGDDIGALGNMDQNQIMQLFSLMNGGNPDILPQLSLNPNTASANNVETPKIRKERAEPIGGGGGIHGSKIDAAMLNQIISALPSTSTSESKKRNIELSKVLTRANVEETVKAKAEELSPHLPTTSEEKEINQTIGSPQFQQSADFFSSALYSGQLGEALGHFNLDKNVIEAANKGELVHFCEELTKSQNKKSGDVDAQINAEAAKEENNEDAVKKESDNAKKGNDSEGEEMDLD